jgi:hypothetical protein
MKPCWIFDIDGTLADLRHRLPHIQKSPKDWDGFFSAVDGDAPIPHVIAVCCTLGLGTPIVLSSGRPERTREATIKWLVRHKVWLVVHAMYMRADGDHRPDFQVKRELLARMRNDGWSPIMAFDDRDQVVRMWRSEGVPCAQVAEGDF